MAKIDTTLTPEDMREAAKDDIIIEYRSDFGDLSGYPDAVNTQNLLSIRSTNVFPKCIGSVPSIGRIGRFDYSSPRSAIKISHPNTRIIGYIADNWDVGSDGTQQIQLYANNFTLSFSDVKYLSNAADLVGECYFENGKGAFANNIVFTSSGSVTPAHIGETNAYSYTSDGNSTGFNNLDWKHATHWGIFRHHMGMSQKGISGFAPGEDELRDNEDNITLTGFQRGGNTTLGIGIQRKLANNGVVQKIISAADINSNLYGKGKLNVINGDMTEYLSNLNTQLVTKLNQLNSRDFYDISTNNPTPIIFTQVDALKYAMYFKVYNLIITHDLDQINPYLDDGIIPTDAEFLPSYTEPPETPSDLSDPSDDDSGDSSNENGDNGRDTDATPTVTPTITPQHITNSNLYWLQAGELDGFITWFWGQMGQITDFMDLLDRIKGMYADLVNTILSIRYMPINRTWIGGAGTPSPINIGMISYGSNFETLAKANPVLRRIGTITIDPKYNSFCDYSPYADLYLYLPFHGFIALDNDIFIGHTLGVYAIYDVISGTIQYFIYCDDFLANTCVAQMAVEIPITLQSNIDRMNAIHQNASNAAASLIGAAGAIASGNPIGLVEADAALSQVGQQSAPLKVMGTIGETGAFYAPQKCAIYQKFPSYNRPANYKSQVGFPCNKQYRLSTLRGYTEVYNARITNFRHAAKPYEDEIEELYSLMEGGIYL